MMSGSFLQAIDVSYSGGLDSKVVIDAAGFVAALGRVRKMYFRHRALYRGLNGNDFGPRLRKLLDDRSGDYQTFADDLGINLLYLQSLMDEPFTVSNPSARLLKRMSTLLGVSVGYLLGETIETDPVLTESLATWNAWIENTPNIQAAPANRIKRGLAGGLQQDAEAAGGGIVPEYERCHEGDRLGQAISGGAQERKGQSPWSADGTLPRAVAARRSCSVS